MMMISSSSEVQNPNCDSGHHETVGKPISVANSSKQNEPKPSLMMKLDYFSSPMEEDDALDGIEGKSRYGNLKIQRKVTVENRIE